MDLDPMIICLDPLVNGVDYEEPFERLWNRTRTRLQEPANWEAIRRGAEALLEKQELTREEVLRLVQR